MFEYNSKFVSIVESRILFEEVMANYYNKNYRSCIVNLNSLLYFDLVKKLEQLRDNYNDEKSQKILETIKISTSGDDKYSESELKLLTLCKDRNLIDKHFYEEALNLRKVRNHCAHPAFYNETLFIPDCYEVQMYINLIYNKLLILNPINYYGAVDYILQDIENAYDKGISASNDSLKERANRLFNKLDMKNKQKVFNSLFELSVIKNTEDCKKFRHYTYNYMIFLLDCANILGEKIVKEVVKKLNISHLDEQYITGNPYVAKIVSDRVISLNDVEIYNPEIYSLYREFLINSSEVNNIYLQLFGSLEEYTEYLISDDCNWQKVKKFMDNIEQVYTKKYFYKILKKLIVATPNFDSFDLGDYCINKYYENCELLTNEQSDELLLIMSEKSQFFNSSKRNNKTNKEDIEELYNDTDFDELIKKLRKKYD